MVISFMLLVWQIGAKRSKLTISEVLLYFLVGDLLWLTTMGKIAQD